MLRPNHFSYKALALFLLTFCCFINANAQTKLRAFAGGVRPQAIWTDRGFFAMVSDCRKKSCNVVAANQCVFVKMRAQGASLQAIEFANYAPAPAAIDQFKVYGNVAVVHARMQWADASDGFFLITNRGVVIPVFDQSDLVKDARYQAFQKRFPRALLANGPGRLTWPKVDSLANGNQRFVFAFPILNGCMACKKIGRADVTFAFDAKGNYLGARLVEITSPPVR